MRPTTVLSALFTVTVLAHPTTNTSYVGPAEGHLVIVGGNLQSDVIWNRIITLAGGPSAPIVVVPTAGGEPTYDADFPAAVTLRELGATNVTVLHTYDPVVADTDAFIAPLLAAKGIFFGGGRQWRLVDAYAGTKAEKGFQAVLDRGGVISGSSAGASIIGACEMGQRRQVLANLLAVSYVSSLIAVMIMQVQLHGYVERINDVFDCKSII
jgi:cyanophycinase-like exopeptidase